MWMQSSFQASTGSLYRDPAVITCDRNIRQCRYASRWQLQSSARLDLPVGKHCGKTFLLEQGKKV